MDVNGKPKRNQSLVWRELDGETAIISGDNQALHTLNGVGSRIWSFLDGTHDIADIVSTISNEYQEDEEIVKRDVTEYLDDLKELNLLES